MLTGPELAAFLRAIVAFLLAAHCFGFLFELLKLPRVIGEIMGGLVIGPTVLGAVAPELSEFLVSTDRVQQKLVSALYWIGLTLLMFTAGLRIQHGFVAQDRRLIAALLIGATAVPFALGWISSSSAIFGGGTGAGAVAISTALVLAIAFSVTSIPVISKIFIDLGLMEGRFARIVLAAATLQDVLLWAALAVATGLAGAQHGAATWSEILLVSGKTLAFCAVGLTMGPVLLRFVTRSRIGEWLRKIFLGGAAFWCFLVAAAAAMLDVNVVFGAFVAGVALASVGRNRMTAQKEQITAFAMAFFVPIYFAAVGFRIDMARAFHLDLFLSFLILSTAVKAGSVFAAMRFAGTDSRTAWNFAVAMNTRGGPGIVLASVAFEYGLIGEPMFVALVLTSVATSLASGIWFKVQTDRSRELMTR